MPILDDRGRLFGTVNLIDAAAVVFVVALVPLAYGSWALFRTPPPVVTAVTPSVLQSGKTEGAMIRVDGKDLRPYLSALIGTKEARYLFVSTTRAELRLPALSPGTYDIALFDVGLEVARRAGALVVSDSQALAVERLTPVPFPKIREPQRIELRGKHLRPGLKASVGEQLVPYQFLGPDRARIEVPVLDPGSHDVILLEGDKAIARFPKAVTVAELEVVARFVTRPEVVETIRQAQRQPFTPAAGPTTIQPVLTSFEVIDELRGTTMLDQKEGHLSVVKARIRVAAVRTAEGWQMDGRPLRAGGRFTLDAPTYSLNGDVLGFDVAHVRKP